MLAFTLAMRSYVHYTGIEMRRPQQLQEFVQDSFGFKPVKFAKIIKWLRYFAVVPDTSRKHIPARTV
jgi:hypothetical protein